MPDARPIRVVLYARVSTSNHGQDVTVQTRELKGFVQPRGWQPAGEYVDLAIPGVLPFQAHTTLTFGVA
jgi:hypothetical protein